MAARRRLIGLLLALPVALSACGGGGSGGDERSRGSQSLGSALEHVHGLGVNPADGTLYIATHHGMFRAANGSVKVERHGKSEQDVMGFSVVDPDHFIGSGHPSPLEKGRPPLLGLIESRDAGKSWTDVSLLGQADFHVLRSQGRRVYGFDSSHGRFMVSVNRGRSWTQRQLVAPMVDLAIDPRDADHIVAATEKGLSSSANAGKAWRALPEQRVGLLAWPSPGALYLLDAGGRVHVSVDAGRRFTPAGSIGGQPAAFASYGDELYAARADGTVVVSTNEAEDWTVRASP